jgi:hypothetical protein
MLRAGLPLPTARRWDGTGTEKIRVPVPVVIHVRVSS